MLKDKLPENFKKQIESLFLKSECFGKVENFYDFLDLESFRGIRYNSLKIDNDTEFEDILKEILIENLKNSYQSDNQNKHTLIKKVPWSDDGYYLPNDVFPGKNPLYNTGIFYLQEPSAMLPARILNAKPGEKILDICAAPGGKTIKIASDMDGRGILFSNDINEERTKALVKNIELAGCTNCVVLNGTPEKLSNNFVEYFDKILIDAPCSGEGMFRKDPAAIISWEKFGPQTCVLMQKDILQYADKMLMPGGELVYSTCTFNEAENEEMISWFLEKFPAYETLPSGLSEEVIEKSGISRGIEKCKGTLDALRIFPHIADGEGHFVIRLKKTGSGSEKIKKSVNISTHLKDNKNLKEKQLYKVDEFKKSFYEFSTKLLADDYPNEFFNRFKNIKVYNAHVYVLPEDIPDLQGINVPKKGFYTGKLKRIRENVIFEPSHSFALSLRKKDLKYGISFENDDMLLNKYLTGQTIFLDDVPASNILGDIPDNGYIVFLVKNYCLGWGKISQKNLIKNLFPHGWVKR